MVKHKVALVYLLLLEQPFNTRSLLIPSIRRPIISPLSKLNNDLSTKNVEQTMETSREKIMTFSYDMSLEPKYEKPTYAGTGNGLSGKDGEYDVIVIGSGMGGLSCGVSIIN